MSTRPSRATISSINAGILHTGIPRPHPSAAPAESAPPPPVQPSITENDWALDPESGCHNWLWCDKKYRPLIRYNGKRELAYRVNWELRNGPIPDGCQIKHRCNNGRCVNPEHLYLDDSPANTRVAVPIRISAPRTPNLTWAQAQKIRAEYEPGKTSHKNLGLEYGVSDMTISNVLRNKTFHDPAYTPQVSIRRRLNREDAAAIRRRYSAEPVSILDLAHDFGVSSALITQIIHNKTRPNPDYTPPTQDEIRRRAASIAMPKIARAKAVHRAP